MPSVFLRIFSPNMSSRYALTLLPASFPESGIALAELGQHTASGISFIGVKQRPPLASLNFTPEKKRPKTARSTVKSSRLFPKFCLLFRLFQTISGPIFPSRTFNHNSLRCIGQLCQEEMAVETNFSQGVAHDFRIEFVHHQNMVSGCSVVRLLNMRHGRNIINFIVLDSIDIFNVSVALSSPAIAVSVVTIIRIYQNIF